MVSSMPAQEALARLSDQERGWVEAFRNRVREGLGDRLRDLRIYGSRIRGDAREESDIDLLVLVDGCDFATTTKIWDLAHSISAWLSANVFDFEEYHAPKFRASGFYREMRTESVRL